MIKTEAEAWDAIADTLEMIDAMPPFRYALDPLSGLCAVVTCMRLDGAISGEIRLKMMGRLPIGKFLFPMCEHLPRIRHARKLARLARLEAA